MMKFVTTYNIQAPESQKHPKTVIFPFKKLK